jgi:hypothetical protein
LAPEAEGQRGSARPLDRAQQVLDRELDAEVDRIGAGTQRRERRHQQTQLVSLTRRSGEDDPGAEERGRRRHKRRSEQGPKNAGRQVLGRDSHLPVGPAVTDHVHQWTRDLACETRGSERGELDGEQPLNLGAVEMV